MLASRIAFSHFIQRNFQVRFIWFEILFVHAACCILNAVLMFYFILHLELTEQSLKEEPYLPEHKTETDSDFLRCCIRADQERSFLL